VAALNTSDLYDLRFRDRVAFAVRKRLELATHHKEAVRRGTTLFALPIYAADGAKAVWGTADAIWDTLGDQSQDYNWYTKRSILSAVYSSTVLFWLGDESEGQEATWAFLDRRIDNVMQFEKVKGATLKNPVFSKVFAGPLWVLGKVKAPTRMTRSDLPGTWRDPSAS
jgi:ubiquinone biosynthesis protein COQ9